MTVPDKARRFEKKSPLRKIDIFGIVFETVLRKIDIFTKKKFIRQREYECDFFEDMKTVYPGWNGENDEPSALKVLEPL